jgi:hypothetical protein
MPGCELPLDPQPRKLASGRITKGSTCYEKGSYRARFPLEDAEIDLGSVSKNAIVSIRINLICEELNTTLPRL